MNSKDPTKDRTKGIALALDSAGSFTRSGILSGAKLLASGIHKTSEIIKTKTLKSEKNSDLRLLPKIETASKTTSFIVNKSHSFIGKTVNNTLKIAEKTWNAMPDSELMKKIREDENFKIAFELSKASAGAGINIVGGLVEGLTLVTDSSVKATVDIIDHKCGENAAKATKESFNIAGNFVGFYQMTHFTGLIGISAGEIMKIQEEEEKFTFVIECLTRVVI